MPLFQRKKISTTNINDCLFSSQWRLLVIPFGTDFVKQEVSNFKGAIKGTGTKGKLSLKTPSLLLLGTAECFKSSCAQRILYVLTPPSVTDSIQIMTLEATDSSASFLTEARGHIVLWKFMKQKNSYKA